MIPFDSNNPFPLLELNSYSYGDAQEHSVLVDQWLGFRTEETEKVIRDTNKNSGIENSQQNWEHLSVQAMQTPYLEIRNILNFLNLCDGDHIADLGCAYGRMGFIINAHYPQVRFSGYELENERILESQRLLSPSEHPLIRFIKVDLSKDTFKLPEANVYFIFDYGSEKAVNKTLADLQAQARKRPLQVIARGKLSRFLIHKKHPWLAEVNSPRHFPHFSIYQS